MRCFKIFLLLLLVSVIPSIRADDDDDDTCYNPSCSDDDDDQDDNTVSAKATVPPVEAPVPAPPVAAPLSSSAENEILTFLRSLNNKVDRLEEAVALLRISTDSKTSDSGEVIQAIKESQTALEIGIFNVQQTLLRNREVFCDSKLCDKKTEKLVEIPKDGLIRDCCAVQKAGNTESGLYTVYPYENDKTREVKVYCDLETKGGGWTVIQRREEAKGPTENFQRNWAAYEAGFGNKDQTFWQGLPDIAALTEDNDQTVRFDMTGWKDEVAFAEYAKFHVNNASDLYRMTVSGYSGTAGDSFSVNSGNAFSTLERDNDIYGYNCADIYKGAWWYRACHWANPNGLYVVNGTPSPYGTGINWNAFKGLYYSLKRIDMKLRNRHYPNGCAA